MPLSLNTFLFLTLEFFNYLDNEILLVPSTGTFNNGILITSRPVLSWEPSCDLKNKKEYNVILKVVLRTFLWSEKIKSNTKSCFWHKNMLEADKEQQHYIIGLWVSEWYCCLMSNQQFFNYFMARTNYISMRWWWCPLSTTPTCLVGFVFIVLAHWNDSPQVDMSPHTDTLSWYWANQSLLLLLNAVC